MAVTVSAVTGVGAGSNPYRFVVDIIATDDGDTDATITLADYGFTMTNLVPAAGGNTATPTTIPQALNVTIVPLLADIGKLSGWAWTNSATASTTIVVTKQATTGSGNAAKQVRVIVERAIVYGR